MRQVPNNIRLLLALLLTGTFIASCGGGGGGGETETDIAPTVTLISPINGSTLSGDTPVIIRFDQSMTTGSLSLTGPLAGESNGGVWSTTALANDTLTLTPTMTWQHGLGRTLGLDAQNTNATSLAQAVNLSYDVNNTLQRVNVDNAGDETDAVSDYPSISGDGRFVAFESRATNLVPGSGDMNGNTDIFVRDRNTNTTTRVSVVTGGAEAAGGNSGNPSISADGRYVAFQSGATNLVAASGDTNAASDIFVHDRLSGETTRVSVVTGGGEADGSSYNSAMSADGRYVAFDSVATDLVADDTNVNTDIFVHDRDTNTTTRVSVATGGAQATGHSLNPSISADGRYVAFQSGAANLVAGDANTVIDTFVHDRDTNTTTRVSVVTGGDEAGGHSTNPAISADGRYVAFDSSATNLLGFGGDTNGDSDIFVHDRDTTTTTRVSVATGGAESTGGHSYTPAISADGRYVAFESTATTLRADDTSGFNDIYVHDMQTGTTAWVNVPSDGTDADERSYSASISADGRYIAFESEATNMVGGDTNTYTDIFVTPTPY